MLIGAEWTEDPGAVRLLIGGEKANDLPKEVNSTHASRSRRALTEYDYERV